MATDLLLPVFVGVFFLILGGFFLLLGGAGRLGRWSEVAALVTDDSGIWVEPLVPASYPNDRFIEWSLLDGFWVYQFGRLGSTIALRSRRGEFLIGSFSTLTVQEIAAELRRRGRHEAKDWQFKPTFSPPLAQAV